MRQHRQEDPDRTATPPVERGSRHRLLNVMEAHRDRFEQIVLPVAVTIAGIASLPILDQTLRVVREFRPLSGGGRCGQKCKTSRHFDGTVRNPERLG